MRGILFVVAISLLVAGCAGPSDSDNISNITNITNETQDNGTQDNQTICLGPVCGADWNTYETDCEAIGAGVAILHTGACIEEEECTETDEGIDRESKGTVTKGNETYEDYCMDEQQLVEYACIDNDIDMATFNCGEGKECKDGACAEIVPEQDLLNCVGPISADIHTQGSVTLNNTVYQDVCVQADVVKDYYCKDNKVESINHQCPPGEGCNAGKCYREAYVCTDADYGANISVRARVLVLRGYTSVFDKYDECIDEGKVKEYSCSENNTAITEEIECGSGYKCLSGRCVESKCSETDGGLDYYKTGVVSIEGQEKEYEDTCFGDYQLKEYYCYGDGVDYREVICPKGYFCYETRCLEGSITEG